MSNKQLLPSERGVALPIATAAYVNDAVPLGGVVGLRVQVVAVGRRARRDGVAVGLLVIESGGCCTGLGLGRELHALLQAAEADPCDRVLYIPHTDQLGHGAHSVLRAIDAIAEARFTLREPCGTISVRGRRVSALRASCLEATRRALAETHEVDVTAVDRYDEGDPP